MTIQSVDVFIPTLNAGPRFRDVIAAVLSQKAPFEIRLAVIDSGSTDGTIDLLARKGIPIQSIAPSEFDHGLTRNRGILSSNADLTALLSQDARPISNDYLAELAAPFGDPEVAGAFACQIPRADCHPFQRQNLARHDATSTQPIMNEPIDAAIWAGLPPEERLRRIAFDNVASMVRRSVVARIPFKKVAFGEDAVWARDVLTHGYRIAFCPAATVEHSHEPSKKEFFDRVILTAALRKRLCDFTPVPNRMIECRRIVGTTLRFLGAACRTPGVPFARRIAGIFSALPFAAMQIEAMYRGARSEVYEPPEFLSTAH